MKKTKKIDDHHCKVIAQKHLELDMVYCNATYDSKEALANCLSRAKESSTKREKACNFS